MSSSVQAGTPDRRDTRYSPWLLAGLMLLASGTLTWLLWQAARSEAAELHQAAFHTSARDLRHRLEQRMAAYEQVLRGTQGLFLASQGVTRREFAEYVRALKLDENYPGMQGLGLSRLIPRDELLAHIYDIRREGFPDYDIWPGGSRPVYTAVTRIEPFSETNRRALGFDMFSEPLRRAAMEQARDTGRAAITAKLRLIQENDSDQQAGIVMYLPIYRQWMPVDSVEQRRASHSGWVYVPFRINNLMTGLGANTGEVDIRLFDGLSVAQQNKMFDSDASRSERDAMMQSIETLSIAGRTWTIEVDSRPDIEAVINSGKPVYIATAGMIGSVLLSLLIFLLASGRARAVALAHGMTIELRRARDELEAHVQERTADLRATNKALNLQIVERRKIESDLLSSRERLASVFDAVTDGLLVQSRGGTFIELNRAAETILGFTAAQMAGARSLSDFMRTVHEDGTEFARDMHPAMVSVATGKPQRDVVMGLQRSDGRLVWVSINTELLFDHGGEVDLVVSNFADITDKKASEELIWHQANYDALTGLPNRRLFQEHLETEIKKSNRSGLPLALMFLDLDRFKDVNDTLGHDVGDILLREAALRLRSCVRASDTVARLGGDEFTIILSELENLAHIAFVAQNILHRMSEPFQLGIESAYVSASVGITLYPQDARDVDTLLKNADQAMYSAKNQGRNRYRYFTESMQQATQARMWMANELRGALARGEFELFYQPIVDLESGTVYKAEALIRWRHPLRGYIPPSVFIPIAEETGLIVEIGEWVFREVASQIKHWRDEDNRVYQVSINRSPVQFRTRIRGGGDSWTEFLRKIGLPGHSIAVEITEGLLLEPNAMVVDQLAELREAGVQVSLDDFGTGYSALSYLKKFDIDSLKIDQSFVRNLHANSEDMALCEAIIVMAHKLNIKVIAEGVETEEQRALLAGVGCDFAQGYLFSRPVPAAQFMV
ncbi:EAL domain-containing protein [Lacisediminimonas sp.]|uniref:bifunctional diguanylate cyclase/phosphodiesterase n=1 Tax=Lacisediminimonas sp. TaxID=3060582 RepID=UPI00271D31CC|nr:EAL domain-containing protein [Lacisediminimonas sp.]MDO8301438.1 EAL domain-containing protein [Lacisediminimonas sp.]MDO9218378.1 EAL domain-containing protein [Lacisediminimonas sp.]